MIARPAAVLLAVTALLTVAAPASAPQEEVDAGQQVFEANCAMCHGTDAAGMRGMHPSLRGAVDRLTHEGVEVAIRNGRNTNPPMPAFEGRLTDQQIDQVIASVESLPPGPRNFGPEMEGGGMMDGMMGGWMWLLPLLLVIAVTVAIIAAVRSFRDRRSPSGSPSPRELLDQRYASGEIDRDEYLQRREDLDS